ncbi:hypothetical protein JCM1841_005239, partial [Sporobolomyces salmonicolor]
TQDSIYPKVRSALEQVSARRGAPIIIANDTDRSLDDLSHHIIRVPKTVDCLQGIINIVPLQLLSYHVAVAKGCNVDMPRNLAKSTDEAQAGLARELEEIKARFEAAKQDEKVAHFLRAVQAELDLVSRYAGACCYQERAAAHVELKGDPSTITELAHENADLATEKEPLMEHLALAEAAQEELQAQVGDRDETVSSLLGAQESEKPAYIVVATLEEDLKQAHDRERSLVLEPAAATEDTVGVGKVFDEYMERLTVWEGGGRERLVRSD